MNALEESTNERIAELCERRVAGLLSEHDYRNHRRLYLEQMEHQILSVPMMELEARWALSRPRMLVVLALLASGSVYMTYSLVPSATSWIFR